MFTNGLRMSQLYLEKYAHRTATRRKARELKTAGEISLALLLFPCPHSLPSGLLQAFAPKARTPGGSGGSRAPPLIEIYQSVTKRRLNTFSKIPPRATGIPSTRLFPGLPGTSECWLILRQLKATDLLCHFTQTYKPGGGRHTNP